MRFLYSPKQADGERCWKLEEMLGDLESSLAPLWTSIATDFFPLDDPSLRKGLALFIAVMHLRHPDVRREVERMHRALIEFYESAPRLPDGTPDLTAVEINGRAYEVSGDGWQAYRSWGKDDHDRFFTRTVESEAVHIAERLMGKRWSVVFAQKDSFVTSDKPVCIDHQTRPVFGFGTAGAIISFPISPRRILIMDDMHSEPSNQYYPLKESNAGAFNLTIWRNGSRFLITGRPIPEVLSELLALEFNLGKP